MGSQRLFEPLRGFRKFIRTSSRKSKMVFRSDPVESAEEVRQRENMVKTAKVGKDVVKVVQRCDEAEETKTLDLSHCSLMKVPEAVTFILTERAYDIIKVNLAHNKISKITPQSTDCQPSPQNSVSASSSSQSTSPSTTSWRSPQSSSSWSASLTSMPRLTTLPRWMMRRLRTPRVWSFSTLRRIL